MIDPTTGEQVTFCPVTEFDLFRVFEKQDMVTWFSFDAMEKKFEVIWQRTR